MTRSTLLIICWLFIFSIAVSDRATGQPPVPANDAPVLIAKATLDRPFLFQELADDQALQAKVAADPLLRQVAARVLAVADRLLEIPPVEREKIGRRMLHVSRLCLKRVLYLTLAYHLSGKESYVARAEAEMLAAARFTDWNPSHFLDVAEMTAALAIGYDCLYQQLSPATRQTIETAIINNGLNPSLQDAWWIDTENNWNQVCHAGLTLGALAVMDKEPDLSAKIIQRAIKNVPVAMAEYAPDGAYPEGPGYWNYGTTYNVLLIAALESALGTDFGLSQSEGFLESADYYLHATGPTGLLFNYSDGGARTGVSPAMYWFATRRNDSSLLWHEKFHLERLLASELSPGDFSNGSLPLLLLWSDTNTDLPTPKTRHWQADGKTPVAMHRSSWSNQSALFVGVKAGSPATSHGQMDIGSFVLDALGTRWAEDLGAQPYHNLEAHGIRLWDRKQDGQRWDVFRLNNFSHNTLVVDGKKQQVSGNARIIEFSQTAPLPHTIVDLSPVYENQLAAARRGFALYANQAVKVQDELQTLDRQTTIRWGMVTRANVEIVDPHTAILQRDNQELALKLIAPSRAQLQLYDTATPPGKIDIPNQGTRMIGFTIEVPAATKESLIVMLGPHQLEHQTNPIKVLADW